MAKKITDFKTRGMNRDLSVSAFNPEFSFENHNLRLSTNDGNTLMSWVNEKGTEELTFRTGEAWSDTDTRTANVTEIIGTTIGTAIINNQLVLFTHLVNSSNNESGTPSDGDDEGEVEPYAPIGKFEPVPNLTKATKSRGADLAPDRIYLIKYTEDKTQLKGICLFAGNLNFDVEHPIEALVSYESELIQKVYWTDGKNQPRLINIAHKGFYYYNQEPINTAFDFIPKLELEEKISIERLSSALGEFPAGTIQYAFTYYNKYGQETNIFYTTPLYYIAHLDRGGAPDDKISTAFKIFLSDYDIKFEYLRVYSIIRTSLNATPIVRRVQDVRLHTTETIPITDVTSFMESLGTRLKDAWTAGTGGTTDNIYISTAVVPADGEEQSTFSKLSTLTGSCRHSLPAPFENFEEEDLPNTVDPDPDWYNVSPEDVGNIQNTPNLIHAITGVTGVIDDPEYYKIKTPEQGDPYAFFWTPRGTVLTGEIEVVSSIEKEVDIDGISTTITYPVKGIGDEAFSGQSQITSIICPDTIIEVGHDAFATCTNLNYIGTRTSPTSVTDNTLTNVTIIGAHAFRSCESIAHFIIPGGVSEIGENVFINCVRLEEIIISPNVTTIKKGAFENCVSLKSITIPNTVTYLATDAFIGCNSIETVNIDLTTIDSYFAGIQTLKSVTIGNNARSIGMNAFENCSGLIYLEIGDNVTSIADTALCGISNNATPKSYSNYEYLETIIVGSRVPRITDNTFAKCPNLKNLTIKGAQTSISTDAFKNCPNITSLSINLRYVFGTWFSNKQSLLSVEFGNSVKAIGSNAFFGCNDLESIILGESIGSDYYMPMGNYENDDPNLIPSAIAVDAFEDCINLMYVTALMNTPTAINPGTFIQAGNGAFLYVKEGKKPIYSTTAVWEDFGYDFIKEIGGEDIDDLVIKIDGLCYKIISDSVELEVIIIPNPQGPSYSGDIVIPEYITYAGTTYAVTSIQASAFENCTNLYSVTIPNTITSIEENAFKGCVNLANVIVLTENTSTLIIGQDAFHGCSALSGGKVIIKDIKAWCSKIQFTNEYSNPITFAQRFYLLEDTETPVHDFIIPQGVMMVTDYTFYNCAALDSVNVHSSVGSVAATAFKECNNLKTVYLDSNPIVNPLVARTSMNQALDSIFGDYVESYILGRHVVGVGDYAFSGCVFLKTVTLPESYALPVDGTIGAHAFEACSALGEINIPDNIIEIEEYAFADCTNLKSVIFGENLGNLPGPIITGGGLGRYAFSNCTKLVYVKAKMTTHIPKLKTSNIPVQSLHVFDGISNSCELHIPYSTTEDIKQRYINAYWTEDVFKGGIIQPKDPRWEEGEEYFYIFNKADYPNLVIKFNNLNFYYTWGENSTLDSKLYYYPAKAKFVGTNTVGVNTEYACPRFFCETEIDGEIVRTNLFGVSRSMVSKDTITVIDTNLIGEIIDPTHLLYLGGEGIIAQTIEQKDNTLFLGNLITPHTSIDTKIKQAIADSTGVNEKAPLIKSSVESILTKRPFTLVSKGDLGYINTLSCPEGIDYKGASAFKANEYYRLGIQFQHNTGRWSEPIWIGDKRWEMSQTYHTEQELSSWGPSYNQNGTDIDYGENVGTLSVPEFVYTLPEVVGEEENACYIQRELINAGYKRVRAVYVQPDAGNRTILCQGVVNSTMYRKCDRREASIYAQSSWLFRTKFTANSISGYRDIDTIDGVDTGKHGGSVGYEGPLPTIFNAHYEKNTYDEFGPSWTEWNTDVLEEEYKVWMPYYRSTEIMGAFTEDEMYWIDDKFITLHSPDIEFDSVVINTDLSNSSLYSIGYSQLNHTYGDIDIQTSTPTIGSSGKGFIHKALSSDGTSALISGNYYEDHLVWAESKDLDNSKPYYKPFYDKDDDDCGPVLWPVFMWHRKGSLNNDVTRDNQSSKLLKKKISNYRNSNITYYKQQDENAVSIDDLQIFNASEAAQIIKVNSNIYQGNVDTLVTPSAHSSFYFVGEPLENKIEGWSPSFTDVPITKTYQSDIYNLAKNNWTHIAEYKIGSSDWMYNTPIPNNASAIQWKSMGNNWDDLGKVVAGFGFFREGVPIKYKSTPHIVISLASPTKGINDWNLTGGSTKNHPDGTLPVVELRKQYDPNMLFGGTSPDAFQAAVWIPCGPVVNLDSESDTNIEFKWGDTYFQRYECLKTYPYTNEDLNQVIEIGSFVLETRVNIDGRYDRNRGMTSNLNVSPQNFNLINPVYSQLDNFFNYKILPEEYYKNTEYSNQVTWTKTKESGAEIDLWTNITLASVLELDGTCGQLNKLIRFSDQLIAFQDTGISQILYNDNTQISTTEGVPIEIANSGKVTGKRYFTNTVGCSNKWSISRTPAGLYFLDSNDKSIYIFGGDLSNLSGKFGFNTWCKKNIPSATVKWCPPYEENEEEKGFDNFVTYYDKLNQDVLIINKETALAFSEKIGAFTSFYDYGNSPYFCNLEDTGIWVKSTDDTTVIWRHQTGEYCRFFDENYPYYITLVGNPEPKIDKIFTNIEFRACIEGEPDTVPFDFIEVWDEYQHGIANLSKKNGTGAAQHNLQDLNTTASINRKFRMWRCDIPRDNYPLDEQNKDVDIEKDIARYNRKPLDRMRNSWIYLKLMKNAATGNHIVNEASVPNVLPKAEVHDFIMTYYN